MRKIVLGFSLISIVLMSSCAQCNVCVVDSVENDICTNSVLDRAKAKANCKKAGGNQGKLTLFLLVITL